MLQELLKLVVVIMIAFMAGKLVSKIQLPAILGWLVTGMLIGPHGFNFMNENMMSAEWFHVIVNICEVMLGILIGSELIIKELKKSGKQIAIICLLEGMGAFLLVSLAFYAFGGVPMHIAVIFGAIALATAPAPSLSIVKEYNANGPVAKTLIPLAALDDILAVLVFFIVIGMVTGTMTGEGINLVSILMMIVAPLLIGLVTGVIGAMILKKECGKKETILKMMVMVLITTAIGIYVNKNIIGISLVLPGLSFAAVIANMVSKERLHEILGAMNPIIGIGLTIAIINLGAPLDYKMILTAGTLTAVYIIARAIGKISGSYIGGKISKADDNVCKYLGFTLLPHSGVSLFFTGIAVASILPFEPEYASLIQGTIAAAAVINEIIAVFLAKQAFKMAGEINNGEDKEYKEALQQ